MAEATRKQIGAAWDEFRESVKAFTSINTNESIGERKRRVISLEANFEEWVKYYFPKYAYAEPATFHKKASARLLSHMEWYEVRHWSRELAKDTRTMFEVLYAVLTGKKKYVVMVSNSYDNAEKFLEPYRVMLDSNQRIIQDYGVQEKVGKWTAGEFSTRLGVKFRALGAQQSPRGTRNEEIRPDVLVITDIDTDEDVRNPEIINKNWKWVEKALIPTRSISKPLWIIFLGNIIAKDCCVVRAQENADHVDIINIRNSKGKSSWPEKNSEADIDRVLSTISWASQQSEYYNNPVSEGGIFKGMNYKKLPPLKAYPFLVCYVDLSYKDGKKNDYKAAVLMGRWKDEYHIRKAHLVQGTTSQLAEGLADIEKYVNGEVPVFWVAEENFMQDIVRAELQKNLKSLNSKVVITPDTRAKKEKIVRIEASLEPLNRTGKLWLNEDEKTNPHMKILDGQFVSLEYGNSRQKDDGPDAAEGAKYIIDQKIITSTPPRAGIAPMRANQL